MQRVKNYFYFKLIVFLLFANLFSVAQNNPKTDFIISSQEHYGFIIAHHSYFADLIKGHIYGTELNYIYRTDGCKPWQEHHNYPEIGVCGLFMYLANPQQLGNLNALYPYINFRLNKPNSKVSLRFRTGAGLTYITKSFDRLNNHKNDVIGSHLNGFVNLRFCAVVNLSNSWRMDFGVGLTHASNGAFETPNLGLNMATVNLGLGYTFGNKVCLYYKDTLTAFKKYWKASVLGVIGAKQLETPLGSEYMAYGMQFNFYRRLNQKNSVGTGLEITYSDATKKVWMDDSVAHPSFRQLVQVGTKLSYAFNVGKLSIPIDFGVYVFKEQKYNGAFFHRLGLRYLVTKHIIANVSLLTHWAKADYFEWGMGYQF